MPTPCCPQKSIKELIALALVCSLLASCTTIGPSVIRSGRLAYNEAITETSNQQMLKAIVNGHYEERSSLLSVASVTANVRVSGQAQIQSGFGSVSDYDGNLVPFAGGIIYEDNPTISYVPVAGEKYLRQLTAPVPVALLARAAQSYPDPGFVFKFVVRSANGLRNPDFLFDDQQTALRFERFSELVTQLSQQHRLHWVANPGGSVELLVDQGAESTTDLLPELLALLGLADISAATNGRGRVVIPVTEALHGASFGSLGIATRSVQELIQIASAAVQAPDDHIANSLTAAYLRPGLAGKDFTIRHASARPSDAYVAVEHRDGWFYIHEGDMPTKRHFRLLAGLWSAAMANSLNMPVAPVLTVPVSR